MRFATTLLSVALTAGAAFAQTETQAEGGTGAGGDGGAEMAADGQTGAPGLITAADPQTVIDQLQAMGYRASYEPYDSGRPRVLTGIAGVNTSIAFYGCLEDMSGCQTLMFTSGMDMPEGSSAATVNNWNQSRIYTRAFLDENNDPYFVMPIPRGQDMRAEEFTRLMNIWEDAVIDFTDEIGFER